MMGEAARKLVWNQKEICAANHEQQCNITGGKLDLKSKIIIGVQHDAVYLCCTRVFASNHHRLANERFQGGSDK